MQAETVLRDYLRLPVALQQQAEFGLERQMKQWADNDPHFAARAPHLPGMRLLRQQPVECLFSFICSSNNHISRITSMVSSLRSQYGDKLCTLEGRPYYAFPSYQQLVKADEQSLRALGFGYRAKFVVQSAKKLQELGGEEWLLALRSETDPDIVQKALLGFHGVGRKVADCVALFSLDQLSCIPVDTHVWQIACRHYAHKISGGLHNKTLTDKLYKQVGDAFRDIFGPRAGWAHSVMFTADLPAFQHMLPTHLRALPSPKKRKQAAQEKVKSNHSLPLKEKQGESSKSTSTKSKHKQLAAGQEEAQAEEQSKKKKVAKLKTGRHSESKTLGTEGNVGTGKISKKMKKNNTEEKNTSKQKRDSQHVDKPAEDCLGRTNKRQRKINKKLNLED
eukprot:gb/GEZN01005927.1/.p1 GENE.gb/GEZN01005927.1/~~gb/GEZN01005927.1/.p1  ORF type:complete len:392 (-),score=82.75 gb/GEZN01005927.1/:137-1312(-)